MSTITLLVMAVALGTDAFSMCLGLGMAGVTLRQILTISLTVLVFHVLMPLLGWFAGDITGTLVGRAAGVIGAVLLIWLGLKMIRSSCGDDAGHGQVPVTYWGLLVLAASVSMDAFSVGFSLGVHKVNLPLTAGTIGLVAGVMTGAGLVLGRVVGTRVGERSVLLGGIILIVIGIKLFLS